MERVKQNQKRIWRLWQYRGLAFIFCLCLCPFAGQGAKKKSKLRPTSQRLAKKSPLKSSKAKKPKRTAKNSVGYKVPSIKKSSFFHKIKLKKGDIIRFVNKQPIHSTKDIRQALDKSSKKENTFSLLVTRNKKDFFISYKVQSSKKRKRFLISQVSQVKPKARNISQRKRSLLKKQSRGIASVKKLQTKQQKKNHLKTTKVKKQDKLQDKKISTKKEPKITKNNLNSKKTLVPKKYKSHLQRAYVTSLNSFIYKKPDFDSAQLYALTAGEKVLISKKVFRPPHRFGSFYKIFLFQPKKVIGYISEAEATAEFFNKKGKTILNPKYKLAEQQMKEDKVLDIHLFEKKIGPQTIKKNKPIITKKRRKYYIGLSTGFSNFPIFPDEVLFGLRLSGYGLLISSVNMDFNFMASPYKPLFSYFDVSASYPLTANNAYLIHLMGGMKFEINRRVEEIEKQNDFGLTGGASLSIPLSKRLLFRLDARAEYNFANQDFSPFFLSSIQVSF